MQYNADSYPAGTPTTGGFQLTRACMLRRLRQQQQQREQEHELLAAQGEEASEEVGCNNFGISIPQHMQQLSVVVLCEES